MPELAAAGVQLATGMAPLLVLPQFVDVHALPELAVVGLHEATGVGPVVALLQVVVV